MPHPKISVLLPIYKTDETFLKEAITSILNQTFSDFELLILDDFPQDDREQIVLSFQDKRITYLKNADNLGIAASRNRLIELAHGKYLAVMDHDDIALPTRFAEQAAVLDKNRQIGVVGCWIEKFPKSRIIQYAQTNSEIEEHLMLGCPIAHTGAMIRKSVLKHMHYEKEFSPIEDYRLWCQLIGKTQFFNIPKVLMKYRWYGENTSKKQFKQVQEITQKIQIAVRQKHPEIWARVFRSLVLKSTKNS